MPLRASTLNPSGVVYPVLDLLPPRCFPLAVPCAAASLVSAAVPDLPGSIALALGAGAGAGAGGWLGLLNILLKNDAIV